jgi:hypothetical protein
VDQVQGFWDEAEQRLIFQRHVKHAGGSPQNFTGFLFPASQPLFTGRGLRPPATPDVPHAGGVLRRVRYGRVRSTAALRMGRPAEHLTRAECTGATRRRVIPA